MILAKATPGEIALAKALENLNAAFGICVAMPIMDIDVRNLAELADWGHRAMIWAAAKLPQHHLPFAKCAFEPGGAR